MQATKGTANKSSVTSLHWVYLCIIAVLTICVFSTSLGVIYSKHQSRNLFIELQNLQNQRDNLHVEWSQLLLEQGTWASDVRVERVAEEHLKMTVPSPNEIKVIRS